MTTKQFFLICFQVIIISFIDACRISLNNDLGDPQPLVLSQSSTDGIEAFLLPSFRDTIHLSNGDKVQIACPGSTIAVNENSRIRNLGDLENMVCVNGKFNLKQGSVEFKDITCESMPQHVARLTNRTCSDQFKEIEIGFYVSDRFLKILEVCFDDTLDRAVYTVFNMTKTIGGFQFGYPRPSWTQGDFFRSINVNSLYTRNVQRRTINNMLGLEATSSKYVQEFNDFYMARGHLVARADFLYASQQWGTFYFVNAAPQWQTFNSGNWMFLESDVRRFCGRIDRDLVVYTGTHGIMTLPHEETGEEVRLFLDFFGNTIRRIPVPLLFWKVVYEPKSKAGVVFLGVNNPYVKSVERHRICHDVCDQISWLTWKRHNVTLGYGYCCEVDDFRRTVEGLPKFEVKSLLK